MKYEYLEKGLQAVQDRFAINDLLEKWARAHDLKEWDLFEEVFAQEMQAWNVYGSLDAYRARRPDYSARSRADGIAQMRLILEPLAQTHHFLGNCTAVVVGDHASASCYVRAYHLGQGRKQGMFEESLSYLECELVRGPQGWRMTKIDYIVYIVLGTMELFDRPELRTLASPGNTDR